MFTRLRAVLIALMWACLFASLPAQQHPPATTSDFFSGTVVACSPAELTVIRKTFGRDPVTKTFTVEETTKVEGKLSVKAHVTVRFVTADGVTRALHIIVRQ